MVNEDEMKEKIQFYVAAIEIKKKFCFKLLLLSDSTWILSWINKNLINIKWLWHDNTYWQTWLWDFKKFPPQNQKKESFAGNEKFIWSKPLKSQNRNLVLRGK